MTIAELTFSLIVNTIDRAGPLRTLLRSLEHQSYPHFEVIVVVGPTRDDTLEMLSEYDGRVRILRCPGANLSQSRNVGLLAAHGDIVAFVDDDAVPGYRWLEQLARLFADETLDATGGAVYLIHPSTPVVQHRIGIASSLAEQVDVRASWLDDIVPPGKGRRWLGRMMGTNMAFRRQRLLEIGGFDEFFEWVYDDTDVASRLSNAGGIVHPAAETIMYHVPASSRNRVALSYNGKWWIQTKSAIYYCIKNGLAAGDAYRAIALRCLHLAHGHWLWSGQLWRERRLTLCQMWRMRFHEVGSALGGAIHGLVRPRRLIPRPALEAAKLTTGPIQAYQNVDSPHQPVVDPIEGYRPAISMPNAPLRICLLSSASPPSQGEGVGRHTNLMARGLFACGHAVHVITRGERDQVSFYDGAYVHQIAPRLERYDPYRSFPILYHSLNHSHRAYERVRRLMLNDGVQVVDSPLWQLDGLVTCISRAVPVVLRLQTAVRQIATLQGNRDPDTRLTGETEAAFVARADYLAPNSRATLQAAQDVYGVSIVEMPYTIVPHGVEPVPDSETRPFDATRRSQDLTVLYVGRLEKRKGILDFLDAIPRVRAKVSYARFIIAGADNSWHDGFQLKTGMDYPTYFSKRYPDAASCVTFTGSVDEGQLRALYQSCDLFVAPSLYESFGLIYLEAMNYAKPVIGCRAGGIPEVVDHGVSGLLVEPEAPLALTEAIVSLLTSPSRLREMGLAGRQRLLDQFTHIHMARSFAQAYRAAIAGFNAESEGRADSG